MNQTCKSRMTEPEDRPVSPWIEAALRAKDPNAFLMGLGETEFAVLLAELDAWCPPASAGLAPGRQRRNGRVKRSQSRRPL